jgi:cellulose synthase/poly-beta-1,6-N-acetylglucosamine synthase-like glycosyltransferase
MFGNIIIAICFVPAILTVVWFAEVAAGCLALRKRPLISPASQSRPVHRTTVLIPAHDEGEGVVPTIRDVQAQLGPNDHILLVADNCTDDTASIAEAAGVEVVVRVDEARRGKGYALEFGVRHLALNPPDVVIVLDADCRIGQHAIPMLSSHAMACGGPVQSLYLMLAPKDAPVGKGLNLFAWRIKNWIRPLGLNLFGLPTQLFGTGMAFPTGLLLNRDMGNNRLAEDAALGIALASAGHPARFLSEARVHSSLPVSQVGHEQQRERWEKGHLENIVDLVPRALIKSLRDGNIGLATLAVDMAVPPLSLLVLVTVVCGGFAAIAVALGAPLLVLAVPLASGMLLVLGTTIAWIAVGRDVLPLRELLRLPLHAIQKLSFYYRIASGKGTSTWIRTDRK